MIRIIELLFSFAGLLVLSPILLFLVLLGFLETGSPLFFQVRVGFQEQKFTLVKFRTMKPDTKSVPSHMAPVNALTSFGSFLRRTKLDEIPQLWNVLCGDMSFVGPRPCLPEQQELIKARKLLGTFDFRPGITGLAQINGIDMSDPQKLASVEEEMLKTLNTRNYFKYIFLTLAGRGSGDRISS